MSHQKGVTHLICRAPSTKHEPNSALGLHVQWLGWVCQLGLRVLAVPPCPCPCLQGRSVKDSTLRRAQRRSFTPASFLEEDTVDFPDELDTSFFARVRGRSGVVLAQGSASGRTVCWQRAALLAAGAAVSNGMFLMGLLSVCPGRSPSRGALHLPG